MKGLKRNRVRRGKGLVKTDIAFEDGKIVAIGKLDDVEPIFDTDGVVLPDLSTSIFTVRAERTQWTAPNRPFRPSRNTSRKRYHRFPRHDHDAKPRKHRQSP
ncbi:MAG: hypothetical protein ACLUSP_11530 [Christensenellales bacterium]